MQALHLVLETEDGTTVQVEVPDGTNIMIRAAGQEKEVASLYWDSADGLTLGHWPDGEEWWETPTLPAELFRHNLVTTETEREEQD